MRSDKVTEAFGVPDFLSLPRQGIFRVNGVKNRIEKICSLLDSAQCARVDLSEHSPHDICGVLKYFFRQLPEPLVPFDFYDFFREVAKVRA